MNTIKLTDRQLATLKNALTCYSRHLEGSRDVKDIQSIYNEVTTLKVVIETQISGVDPYADRELGYE